MLRALIIVISLLGVLLLMVGCDLEIYSLPKKPKLPDLIVKDIWIEPVEPGAFSPGDTVEVCQTTLNIGEIPARDFLIRIYFDGKLILNDERRGLAPGDYITRCFPRLTWPSDTNYHTIKVVVDATGKVKESNEANNKLSKEFRAGGIEHNQPPIIILEVHPIEGPAPLTVKVSAAKSYDPDGEIVAYCWDIIGDDECEDFPFPSFTYTYYKPGIYQITLTVWDTDHLKSKAFVTITVW